MPVNKIDDVPGCCGIKVYRGINNPDWTLNSFKKALINSSFSKRALLINAAYGPNAGPALNSDLDSIGIVKDSTTIMGRLDEITKWIEENDLGEIFEVPIYKNPNYGYIQI